MKSLLLGVLLLLTLSIFSPAQETEETIQIETKNLQSLVLSVPTKKEIIWSVKSNNIEVPFTKSKVNEVDLTILIEEKEKFSGATEYAINKAIQSLTKNKQIKQINIGLIGENKIKNNKKWNVYNFQDINQATQHFWNYKSPQQKALVILSNSEDPSMSNIEMLKKLESFNNDQTALIYYFTTKFSDNKKKGKKSIAWGNLNWQDVWTVTGESSEYIKRHFSIINEMISGLHVFYCDLENLNEQQVFEIKGVEDTTNKVVALQEKKFLSNGSDLSQITIQPVKDNQDTANHEIEKVSSEKNQALSWIQVAEVEMDQRTKFYSTLWKQQLKNEYYVNSFSALPRNISATLVQDEKQLNRLEMLKNEAMKAIGWEAEIKVLIFDNKMPLAINQDGLFIILTTAQMEFSDDEIFAILLHEIAHNLFPEKFGKQSHLLEMQCDIAGLLVFINTGKNPRDFINTYIKIANHPESIKEFSDYPQWEDRIEVLNEVLKYKNS